MKQLLRVHKVLDLQEGERNGAFWTRQEVVFKTERERLLCVEFYGDRKTTETKALKPDDLCEVDWLPVSREWEGRWFTKLEGLGLRRYEQAKMP